MTSLNKDIEAAKKFNHPCKDNCSGWMQGFEKGVAHARSEQAEYIACLELVVEAADEFKNQMLEMYSAGVGTRIFKLGAAFYDLEKLKESKK